MNYEVKIVSRFDELDRDQWDRLNAETPFGTSRWLGIAACISRDLQPFYIMLYDHGRLVGTAVASLTRQTGMPISSLVARRLITSLLGRYPLLICRSPMGGASSLRLPQGDEVAALRAISRALHSLAYTRRASFVILGWLTAAEPEIITRAGGFERVLMDSGAMLPITWSSFDQYVASLGKSMQKDIRRHRNRAREIGITIERSHQFARYRNRLLELIDNVERHHGSEDTKPYTNEVFAVIEKELPDNSVMLLGWVGTTLAGCGLLLHDKGVLAPTLLGMDYDFKYVYFQLFYEAIRYGIDSGIKVIYGGTGAYDFKHRMGFHDQPTYAAFSSHRPIFRWLGRQLARTVSGQTEQVSVS